MTLIFSFRHPFNLIVWVSEKIVTLKCFKRKVTQKTNSSPPAGRGVFIFNVFLTRSGAVCCYFLDPEITLSIPFPFSKFLDFWREGGFRDLIWYFEKYIQKNRRLRRALTIHYNISSKCPHNFKISILLCRNIKCRWSEKDRDY